MIHLLSVWIWLAAEGGEQCGGGSGGIGRACEIEQTFHSTLPVKEPDFDTAALDALQLGDMKEVEGIEQFFRGKIVCENELCGIIGRAEREPGKAGDHEGLHREGRLSGEGSEGGSAIGGLQKPEPFRLRSFGRKTGTPGSFGSIAECEVIDAEQSAVWLEIV